jgi:hypothetical protein
MRKNWWLHGLKFVLFVVVALAALAALGVVVMLLWNWLLPALFGWPVIGFWQALGLLVLSKILLGGLRGGAGRHLHWRARMMDRWDHMTDEERAKFREGMGRRCGRSESTPQQTP